MSEQATYERRTDYPFRSMTSLTTDEPNGMYRVTGDTPREGEVYNIATNTFDRGTVIKLARVDDGKPLPKGVELAMIRPDGKRLIIYLAIV